MMCKFVLAVVCLAGLSAAQGVASIGGNCQKGCIFACNLASAACVDLPPFLNCAVTRAACTDLCSATCTCFAGCVSQCSQISKGCQSGLMQLLSPASTLFCKAQSFLCVPSCPAQCSVTFITESYPKFLLQNLGGLGQSLGLLLPGLSPAPAPEPKK
ncbi:uncharacterized protein LOC101856286 [Aplysia californica]|uniref:Uncharacterized protein LOC101856286 n=1 Tax=Aplysia californica TaxID=6500 RepID=A0ABM0K0G6_APLCA|nr:uncharacterized protein LOC101856286 [Aplysia californica]